MNNLSKFTEVDKHEEIGLKVDNNAFSFYFPPYYYGESDTLDKELTDKDRKRDIVKLMNLIAKYQDNDIEIAKGNSSNPVYAMLWILNDYLTHGYYKERNRYYVKDNQGKIDWKKTIKNNNVFIDDEDNVLYKKYVVSRTNFASDEKFLLIQKECIKISKFYLGWYFNLSCDYQLDLSQQNDKYKLTIIYLKELLKTTFLDYKKELINNMISVLQFNVGQDIQNKKEIFTSTFHTVFEHLVVELFSDAKGDALSKYFPDSTWHIVNKGNKVEIEASKLRPDAIVIDKTENRLYVLDAKYYRYGYNFELKNSNLPQTSDIQKQITYATYIDNTRKKLKIDESTKIYNVFIMPTFEESIECYGYNKPNWIDDGTASNKKSYNIVYALGINLKKMVDFYYRKSDTLKIELLESLNTYLKDVQ